MSLATKASFFHPRRMAEKRSDIWWKDKSVLLWIYSLGFVTGVGLILTSSGVPMLLNARSNISTLDLLPSLVGLAILLFAATFFFKLFSGRVVAKVNACLRLNGGELPLPCLPCPSDIWVFCSTSLTLYYGSFSLETDDKVITRHLSETNELFRSIHNNFTPHIWHNIRFAQNKSVRLRFNLVRKNKMDDTPKHVTILIKVR
jgi:hypothetical protein